MQRVAIVISGGGMSSCYSAGVVYALATHFHLTHPHVVVASSGSVGTASYYVAGQYEGIKAIWTTLLSTPKFVNPWRFWKIMDIDYLIDDIFKKQYPLNSALIKSSSIKYYIGAMNYHTGQIDYFSNRDNVDVFELMRASKAIPVLYRKTVEINKKRYFDFYSSPIVHLDKIKEIGADKIIVINNERRRWYIEMTKSLSLGLRSARFKKNYLNYRAQEEELVFNVHAISLRPRKRLETGLSTNDNGLLKRVFAQGVKETIENKELAKFLRD